MELAGDRRAFENGRVVGSAIWPTYPPIGCPAMPGHITSKFPMRLMIVWGMYPEIESEYSWMAPVDVFTAPTKNWPAATLGSVNHTLLSGPIVMPYGCASRCNPDPGPPYSVIAPVDGSCNAISARTLRSAAKSTPRVRNKPAGYGRRFITSAVMLHRLSTTIYFSALDTR
jgi:hypothetical protein